MAAATGAEECAVPQLLLVHGSGYTQDSFGAQSEGIAGADALSLPGHPEGTPLATVAELARWLERYIRWKAAGPVIVAGNSLGGAIAMEWALRFPADVAGLILIGTGARLRVSQQIFELIDDHWPGSIDTLVDFALGPHAPTELRRRAAEWHRVVGQASTKADYAACDQFDVMDRVGEIKVPTLTIVGTEDKLTPVKFSRYLHEKIAGSELLEVEGAGHLVMAERPDIVNPAIQRFCASR